MRRLCNGQLAVAPKQAREIARMSIRPAMGHWRGKRHSIGSRTALTTTKAFLSHAFGTCWPLAESLHRRDGLQQVMEPVTQLPALSPVIQVSGRWQCSRRFRCRMARPNSSCSFSLQCVHMQVDEGPYTRLCSARARASATDQAIRHASRIAASADQPIRSRVVRRIYGGRNLVFSRGGVEPFASHHPQQHVCRHFRAPRLPAHLPPLRGAPHGSHKITSCAGVVRASSLTHSV